MKKFKKNLFSSTPSVVKKVTAAILCVLLSGLFSIAGCKKDEKKERYPIDIPFTEYSLPETCQWTNLGYDETVIVVNSMETLKQYMIFPEGNTPEFDFSTNSLLLVSGGAERGISGISKKLQQLSDSRYQWNIEIFLDDPDEPEPWIIAITTSKPIIDNAVELNVTTSAVEYPVDVPFELYYVRNEHSCIQDTVIIINSNEELERYIGDNGNPPICTYIEPGFPAIDFSRHSLLLTGGFWHNDNRYVNNVNLKQLSSTAYEWEIDVFVSGGDMSSNWINAVVTKKINSNSTVVSKITYLTWWGYSGNWEDWPDDYSIELCIKNYSLENSSCQWTNLEENKTIIVRTPDELDNYITCSENTYPDLDIGPKNLLITKISMPQSMKITSKRLFRYKEKHVLNVEGIISDMEPKEHIIAFTVDYRYGVYDVELNVKYY